MSAWAEIASASSTASPVFTFSLLELEAGGDRGERRLMENHWRGVHGGVDSSKPSEIGEFGLLAPSKHEC